MTSRKSYPLPPKWFQLSHVCCAKVNCGTLSQYLWVAVPWSNGTKLRVRITQHHIRKVASYAFSPGISGSYLAMHAANAWPSWKHSGSWGPGVITSGGLYCLHRTEWVQGASCNDLYVSLSFTVIDHDAVVSTGLTMILQSLAMSDKAGCEVTAIAKW